MREVVLTPAGEGEVAGDAPDRRVEILSEHEALHATWSRFGPRREGADLHVHRTHADLFFALEGELTLRLGPAGEPVVLPAGALALVPSRVVHGFRNESETEIRFLNLHAPGRRFAEFLRALRDGRAFDYDQHDPPVDGGRPASEAAIGRVEVLHDAPGSRVALLADVEEIGIAEIRSEPGRPPAPAHVHRLHVESLYVLDGTLALAAAGKKLRAGAGAWIQLPPGVPHTTAVADDAPARFLELHTPGCGFGDFLRELYGAGGGRAPRALAGFDQDPA